jgi:hypothetical protein
MLHHAFFIYLKPLTCFILISGMHIALFIFNEEGLEKDEGFARFNNNFKAEGV